MSEPCKARVIRLSPCTRTHALTATWQGLVKSERKQCSQNAVTFRETVWRQSRVLQELRLTALPARETASRQRIVKPEHRTIVQVPAPMSTASTDSIVSSDNGYKSH